MATKNKYPLVRRDENEIEDCFGTKVPDPYRWLEDPDCEETQAFVKAQNEISQPYLASCSARDKFHVRLVAFTLIFETRVLVVPVTTPELLWGCG